MTKINLPFRYAGGKYRGREIIMNKSKQHDVYVEPFVGGGSIFFYKNKAKHNILNDLDGDLINCYKVMRDNPKDLIALLENEVVTKERYDFYKNQFVPSNDLERAQRWYFLNRTSYSGITRNFYWGYSDKLSANPSKWGDKIMFAHNKLQGVELLNVDFEQVLQYVVDNYVGQDVFVYLDPPYFNAEQDKFYKCYFNPEDHIRLQKCLAVHQHHINFLLSYDNCKEVKNLYEWCNIDEKEWTYTLHRSDNLKTEGKRNIGKELLIYNYENFTS